MAAPYWAASVIQSWIALYDQVDPAPEIGAKVAAKAGWTGARRPAHRAVSTTPAPVVSRARARRAWVMPRTYAGRRGRFFLREVSDWLTFGVGRGCRYLGAPEPSRCRCHEAGT